MTKFNLGDLVTYTNKRDKVNISGTLIAIHRDSWNGECYGTVEVLDDGGRPETVSYQYISRSGTLWLQDRFDPRSLRSMSNRCRSYIPMGSRNLVSMLKGYSPEQNGDTDEDI